MCCTYVRFYLTVNSISVKRFLVNREMDIRIAALRILRYYLRFNGLLDEIYAQLVQYFIVRYVSKPAGCAS